MKISIRHSQSGIAIIIVMISIFVLAALVGIFAASMKVETKLAMNANNEADLEWLGRSGVEFARYVLAQQLNVPGPRVDSLDQTWAGGQGGTNDLLSDISLNEWQELGQGKFKVKITDTERKFNINLAINNDALLQQALTLIGTDAADIPTIIGSIQDWIDRDDDARINGAETEFYQSLDPPYIAKNGPIDDLSELLFIKGITPYVYWGPNSTNHPAAVFQKRHSSPFGPQPNGPLVSAGLVDIFTPMSAGRINVNTASAEVLQMIPGIDERGARAIRDMVAERPFDNAGEIINAIQNPLAVSQATPFLDVRSATFEVDVDVVVGQSERHYFAVLRCNSPRDVQILNLRWE